MLISCAIDFGILHFGYKNDRAYACYLPTYASVAAYHEKTDHPDVESATKEAENFVGEYVGLLALGDRITEAQFSFACEKLSRLTGLAQGFFAAKRLRVEPGDFGVELLRSEGGVIGRLDARVVGYESVDAKGWGGNDPSYHAITGPFATAWHHYSHHELGVRSEHIFELLSSEVKPRWSFKEFEGTPIDVTPRLEHAMLSNPHLQVYIGSGVFDAAIPYHGIEDIVAHMRLPKGYRNRFMVRNYMAGHMMYAADTVRRQQCVDIREFMGMSGGPARAEA
jgi:carboxypeptidase C (cathepsin A)